MNNTKISILYDKKIKCLANNKLKNNDTLNYNTLNPKKGGLFCENLFGSNKLICKCKKIKSSNKSILYCKFCKNQIFDLNYNYLLNSYVNLKNKFINPLFYNSNYIPILLNISNKDIKNVLYNNYYIIIFEDNKIANKRVIKYKDYIKIKSDKLIAETGIKGIELSLINIDVNKEIFNLNEFFKNNDKFESIVYKKNLIKYEILNKIKFNNLFVNNLFIKNLFIMHPLFRPIMKLDSGSITSSDLNVIYRQLVYRSFRLNLIKKYTKLNTLINKERLIIQNSINNLFLGKKSKNSLKSISSVIKGKLGLFRYNLLGKRVDFSARSVIVSEPSLNLDECYIPELIAIEVFKPFIYNKLINIGFSLYESKIIIEKKDKFVLKILNKIIKNQFVLLNRAPTLHRLGIQSFKILLTKEKVIKIHPLVCTAFNADFDGDQMAVHIALSKESLCEYKILMNSSRNILNPSNGQYLILPTQDILLGLFYSSILNKTKKNFFLFFNILEVKLAYNKNLIKLNTRIFIKIKNFNFNKIFETTLGRLLVYNVFPGYINFDLINKLFTKKNINNLFKLITDKYGKNLIASFSNNIMKLGFYFSTISGISLCIDDMIIIKNKNKLISNTRNVIKMYNNDYFNGLLSNLSRKKKIIDLWQITIDLISEICIKKLFLNSYYNKNYKNNNFINTLSIIMDSGSRGSESQIKQICGVRGFIFYKNKGLLDLPVLSNLKEGLNAIEYFFFSHSSRKVLADTSLKTSSAGYLTRKLVESSIDVVINNYDCFTSKGINFKNLTNGSDYIESIYDRIYGRVLLEDLIINEILLIKKNTLLMHEEILLLKNYKIDYIKIRSPITCDINFGLCQLCYGLDLSKNKLVIAGECVGIIAAQAIGEPGTQLTMRTFHSGGAFNYKKQQNNFFSNNDGFLVFSKSLKFVRKKNFNIILSKTGKIYIKNNFNKIIESIDIPYASYLYKENNSSISKGDLICKWDLDYNFILSQINGYIILENFIENYNFVKKTDNLGINFYEILDLKLHTNKPFIKIINKKKIINIKVFQGYIVLLKNNDSVKRGDKIIKIIKEFKTEDYDAIGGLPKVSELFEARIPKNKSILAPFDGFLKKNGNFLYLKEIDNNNTIKYNIKNKLLLTNNNKVYFGDKITDGIINPHDILKLYGLDGIFDYYTSEIKFIYSSQGISINDKHIEIILKQMLKKVIIINPGKSSYIKGEVIDKYKVNQLNKLNKNIIFQELLFGITKSSLNSSSFLSKMSFQNTNSVLIKSSFLKEENKVFSIKENTMLGKLIPAGTGFYNKFYDYKSKNKFW